MCVRGVLSQVEIDPGDGSGFRTSAHDTTPGVTNTLDCGHTYLVQPPSGSHQMTVITTWNIQFSGIAGGFGGGGPAPIPVTEDFPVEIRDLEALITR